MKGQDKYIVHAFSFQILYVPVTWSVVVHVASPTKVGRRCPPKCRTVRRMLGDTVVAVHYASDAEELFTQGLSSLFDAHLFQNGSGDIETLCASIRGIREELRKDVFFKEGTRALHERKGHQHLWFMEMPETRTLITRPQLRETMNLISYTWRRTDRC